LGIKTEDDPLILVAHRICIPERPGLEPWKPHMRTTSSAHLNNLLMAGPSIYLSTNNKLEMLFTPMDIDIIENIPPSTNEREDF
jgi:hypothetical protein